MYVALKQSKEEIIRNFIDSYKKHSTRKDGRIDQCIEYMEYLLGENFRLVMKLRENGK